MHPIQTDRLAAFKKSAADLVLTHGKRRLNGNVAADQTVMLTLKVAAAACERLWRLGYELRDIHNLEERHVRALIRDWYSSKHEPKTLQNDVSRLRQICRWIGKTSIIPQRNGAAHFLPEVDPKALRVKTDADRSKSWSENGVDVQAKILEADAIEIRFGAMLRLGLAFGLRRKEQLRIVPDKADAVTHLLIRDNVGKSGKDRDIPIIHPFQRIALEHAKRVAGKRRHLGWPGKTIPQNLGKYAYHMRKIGITGLDTDCVGHGLRAEFAENMALLLGLVPPTLGGEADQMDRDAREAIQLKVSEALGHHRINVTGAYFGRFRQKPVLKRMGETYLERLGFKAQVQIDFDASRLRGVIAGEKDDIEFSGSTLDELRAEFHGVVDKIIADVKAENAGLGGSDEPPGSALPA